jgi:hypothetical protein
MMSWKTINIILGQAATDDAFCQDLLKNPVKAIKQKGFVLSKEEEEILSGISADDLSEFSQRVLVLFGREE